MFIYKCIYINNFMNDLYVVQRNRITVIMLKCYENDTNNEDKHKMQAVCTNIQNIQRITVTVVVVEIGGHHKIAPLSLSSSREDRQQVRSCSPIRFERPSLWSFELQTS